jgi:hypothetical protein
MVLELLLVIILNRLLRRCQQTFILVIDISLTSHNGKVQLGISVDTSMNPFFCFLDCSIPRASDFSCDIFLGRDWFNYVSTTIPNAKISLSETEYLDFGVSPQVGVRIEQGVFFLASI